MKTKSFFKSLQLRLLFLLPVIAIQQLSLLGQGTNPTYDAMPRVIYPSADAGALGRYGDYPVDKSTGVPSIRIPIFDIQLNGYKLPIDLSYHASGNKVDDISSVVGLGWALNAGGCISRTILSLADDHNLLVDPDVYSRAYSTRNEILSLPTDMDKTCALNNLRQLTDLESDIFSFNFNGYTGQFRHNSQNQLILSTYEDLVITGGPRSGYEIKTPDGAQYRFLYGDSMSINFGSYKSCWYIDRIITPNSDTIDFHYGYPSGIIQGEHRPSYHCTEDGAQNESSVYYFIDYIDVIKLRFLKSITYKTGRIDFLYGQRNEVRPHRLKEIAVLNLDGDTIKKVTLGQSYFVSDNSNEQTGSSDKYKNRLRLDKVSFVNPDNSNDKYSYSFVYNSTKLPPYFLDFGTLSSYYSQDYWGYFNNASNSHLIPVANPCTNTAADREVNETAMQATILTKIIYPTGGRTEFTYEANTKRGGSYKIGGLRIKTIKNFVDGVTSTPSLIKSYEYVGGGFTTQWVAYSAMNDLSRWSFDNESPLPNGLSTWQHNWMSSPIGNISYNNGMIAVYDKVWEYTGAQNELKTEYNYNVISEESYGSNYYRPHFSDHHFYPRYYIDEPYRSGQLTSQIEFKKDGTNYLPVKEIQNFYTPKKVRTDTMGIKIIAHFPAHLGCTQQGFPDDNYQFFDVLCQTGIMKLTKTIEKLYGTNGTIEKVSEYEYGKIEEPNGHGFVTKETVTNSMGDKTWKISHYLPDLFPYPVGVYSVMAGKFMISTPLETISGKTINGTDYYLGAGTNLFSLIGNQPRLSQINQMQLESPSLSYTSWTDSRLKSETTLDSYDNTGNILNVTPKDNYPTSFIWGYNNTYPVAKIINARNQINYVNGNSSEELLFSPGENYGKVTTFTTSSLGSITLFLTATGSMGTNATASFAYSLTGATNQSGSLCISNCSGCGSTGNSITFYSLPVGTYHLYTFPTSNNSTSGIKLIYTYQKQLVASSSIIEVFYQSFEEDNTATETSVSMPSYAGKKFHTGQYSVPFLMPNSRSYVVEYHYWDGSKWVNIKKPYSNYMVLNDGTAFDEIRVYPADAQMTTYTYDPFIGMTSSSDENNFTTYYEYDSFWRLKCIRDYNKNILKVYDYHYKE